MGRYLNLGNAGFQAIRRGRYVDKTKMISYVNSTLGTKEKLTCVSRPRRFGKSFTAQMLCAYYDKSCDSRELFQGLEIAQTEEFLQYLNKFNVIYLDVTWFISTVEKIEDTVKYLQREVVRELRDAFPDMTGERTFSAHCFKRHQRCRGQQIHYYYR